MLYYKKYEKDESKEWVVFVHGAGGSSSIWFQQLKAFKSVFNVLLVDLRGHGKSKDALQLYYEEDYTFDDISKDVLQVLDHLEIERAHFVGVSLGTIIIRNLSEIAPNRVKSAILCGAITLSASLKVDQSKVDKTLIFDYEKIPIYRISNCLYS